MIRTAKSCRVLNKRVQNGLQVKSRAANDFQNFAGRRLLVQSFGEVAVASLQFLKQAHVLDGDHRLVGEGLEKSDLLLREWAHLGASDQNNANRNSFSLQWSDQYGSDTLPV